MAEFYREEIDRHVASFPKKRTTRYTALGKREALPEGKNYVGNRSMRELAEDGYTASYRPIATVSVTESEPVEREIKPSEGWYPEDEGGQLRMVSQLSPASTEVGALTSDPSMRAAVPALLAMAIQGKKNITHDVQLSQHSSRLINEVKDAVGIVGPERNPNSEPMYTSDKNNPWVGTYVEKDGKTYGVDLLHSSDGDELERVPDSEVKVAKDTVRSFLRSRKLSPQFDAHVGEQIKFEGMD